ncbi:bifunctional 4-hydroxy-2-oxoglutarate aldolase/2-dehydro-3-deoxy-phosphogluconate aldolase [Stagnihabitans tardus]|uniref:2-dehydro-3-deoxy-phosphogluconate aldolase n=1 Tax=Stagnihabitans tardus TaxID=2699202 RepID=A0AAE4YG73_9RHOB|nr:bifunctional 4-hydroxy-2-oxoglutarate aldolase/2-dehydro-3-deoxy-phosphogluconate aldolase [Stagnihabitans tardus]NBZ89365.1 bifunctional 4-hydroxy-2-oxoglutarate aldolase/2-dehydro-3-deoxy-phosphogluconate aldolase [Stagnihabitans tardus]
MSVFHELARFGVVPVIVLDRAEDALPLADALIAGGLPLAEITLRTPQALAGLAEIARHRPAMLVGAGTVLTEDQVHEAKAAGARFALSPGIDPLVLTEAQGAGLPFAPGIATATEVQMALRAGCEMVKFFPAVPAGGIALLKSIAAPYVHTGLGYNPTGGVTAETLGDWLALPQVRAVGGTWIATQADIATGAWEAIAHKARAAVDLVTRLRG